MSIIEIAIILLSIDSEAQWITVIRYQNSFVTVTNYFLPVESVLTTHLLLLVLIKIIVTILITHWRKRGFQDKLQNRQQPSI